VLGRSVVARANSRNVSVARPMRAPVKTLSLEDLASQIQAQDAELARLRQLAEEIPPGIMLPASALSALEDATEPPEEAQARAAVPIFALRA
jgi:hypothetical protein